MGQATGFCIKLWSKRRRLPLISSDLRWSKAFVTVLQQLDRFRMTQNLANIWWKKASNSELSGSAESIRRLIIDDGILVPWRWWYHHSDQVYCKTTSIWRKHHQHIRRWPFHEPWGMLFACCKLQHFGKHPKIFHHFSAAVRKSNTQATLQKRWGKNCRPVSPPSQPLPRHGSGGILDEKVVVQKSILKWPTKRSVKTIQTSWFLPKQIWVFGVH